MDALENEDFILDVSCLEPELNNYQIDNFSPDDYDDYYYDGLTLLYGVTNEDDDNYYYNNCYGDDCYCNDYYDDNFTLSYNVFNEDYEIIETIGDETNGVDVYLNHSQ